MQIKTNFKAVTTDNSNLLGFADATFDNSIHVKDIAVFKSNGGITLKMPSYKTGEETEFGFPERKDHFYPTTKEARDALTELVEKAMAHPEHYSYLNDKVKAGFSIKTHEYSPEGSNIRGYANVKLGDEYAFNCQIRENKNGKFMVSYPGESFQAGDKSGFKKFVAPTKDKDGLITASIIKEFKANLKLEPEPPPPVMPI